jgi:hypothetical protein
MTRFALPALILVLMIVCLAPGLVNGLSGDDYVHVYKNRAALSGWGGYFLEADGREYRPVVRMSLGLDHLLWGKWYTGYHLTNLLLHLLVTALLFLYVEKLCADTTIAFLAALVFGLHPIHSYSVNATMGRTDVLCALFALAALFAATKGESILSAVLFLMSLLSKELAVVVPLLLGLELVFFPRLRRMPQWRALIFMSGIDLVYLVVRLALFAPNRADLAVYYSASLLGVLRNVAYYAGGLLLPIGHYWLRDRAEAYSLLFVAVGGPAVVLLGLYLFRHRGELLVSEVRFGLLWVVVTLLPVLFLFQRRFLYLASLGFALGLGCFLARRCRRHLAVTTIALLLVFGVPLWTKSLEWRAAAAESNRVVRKLSILIESSGPNRLYVLNVPHSLGDAHLFTHDSLRYAVALELGRLPDVESITRVGLARGDVVTNRVEVNRVISRLKPGPQSQFVFDTPEILPAGGRLVPLGSAFSKGPFLIKVSGTDERGRVAEITVSWQALKPGETWVLL